MTRPGVDSSCPHSLCEVGVKVSVNSRIPGPHCIGIAVAIAVLFGYFPSRATAECGDYVVILNKNSASNQQVEMDSHAQFDPSNDRGHPRTPCRGPNCSSNPFQHTAPLAAPVPTRNESKVSTTQLTPEIAVSDQEEWWPFPTSNESPVHTPDPVFHPPRAN